MANIRKLKTCMLMLVLLSTAMLLLRGYKLTELNEGRVTRFRPVSTEVKTMKMMDGHYRIKINETMECGDYRCRLLRGQRDTTDADLFVFSEIDVQHFHNPPKKQPGDLWAFYSTEPEDHIVNPGRQMKWDGFFNYSTTYNRSTNGSFHIFRDKLVKISPLKLRYFHPQPQMKQLRALWLISHCSIRSQKKHIRSAREEYVLELSKYITVDAYTTDKYDCGRTLGDLIKNRKSSEEPNMSEYMFYLAFENSLCKDYITEKLWKVLESNSTTIPVVLGGLSIQEYVDIAPPNSFIHVRNFTSPEALAKHLKFVVQDDNAFNYYQQWRNHYRPVPRQHVKYGDQPYLYHGDFFCYFCKLIYLRPPAIWTTFSKDYGKHNCLDVSDPKMHCPYYNLTC